MGLEKHKPLASRHREDNVAGLQEKDVGGDGLTFRSRISSKKQLLRGQESLQSRNRVNNAVPIPRRGERIKYIGRRECSMPQLVQRGQSTSETTGMKSKI